MPFLLLIETLCFTSGERKILSNIKSFAIDNDCLPNFLLLFMSLLTIPIVKNSHILAGIYFIFLKKYPKPNFKGFQ